MYHPAYARVRLGLRKPIHPSINRMIFRRQNGVLETGQLLSETAEKYQRYKCTTLSIFIVTRCIDCEACMLAKMTKTSVVGRDVSCDLVGLSQPCLVLLKRDSPRLYCVEPPDSASLIRPAAEREVLLLNLLSPHPTNSSNLFDDARMESPSPIFTPANNHILNNNPPYKPSSSIELRRERLPFINS